MVFESVVVLLDLFSSDFRDSDLSDREDLSDLHELLLRSKICLIFKSFSLFFTTVSLGDGDLSFSATFLVLRTTLLFVAIPVAEVSSILSSQVLFFEEVTLFSFFFSALEQVLGVSVKTSFSWTGFTSLTFSLPS